MSSVSVTVNLNGGGAEAERAGQRFSRQAKEQSNQPTNRFTASEGNKGRPRPSFHSFALVHLLYEEVSERASERSCRERWLSPSQTQFPYLTTDKCRSSEELSNSLAPFIAPPLPSISLCQTRSSDADFILLLKTHCSLRDIRI